MRAMQILRLISSCELQPTAGETDRRTCFVPVESRGLTCVTGGRRAPKAVQVSGADRSSRLMRGGSASRRAKVCRMRRCARYRCSRA